MPKVSKSALVPFSAEQMFDLVNDVAKYPDFLPWCPKAELVNKAENEIEATVHFAKGGISKSFTTANSLKPFESIEMHLVDGPFRQLEGRWCFESLPNYCRVSLDMSFEFSNPLMAMSFGTVFGQLANSMIKIFTKRAYQIYSPHDVY